MSRWAEAAKYVRLQLDPNEITTKMGISPQSICQYIALAIGNGKITRSDFVFSFPKDVREHLNQAIRSKPHDPIAAMARALRKIDRRIPKEFLRMYVTNWDPRPDLYRTICTSEVLIHTAIRYFLQEKFGDGEAGWWRQGVPVKIRQECQQMREADPRPAREPYEYTTFINLCDVIAHNWTLFVRVMPTSLSCDRRKLKDDFVKMNGIRNSVMHPVKSIEFYEDDYLFCRDFEARIDLKEWRYAFDARND